LGFETDNYQTIGGDIERKPVNTQNPERRERLGKKRERSFLTTMVLRSKSGKTSMRVLNGTGIGHKNDQTEKSNPSASDWKNKNSPRESHNGGKTFEKTDVQY